MDNTKRINIENYIIDIIAYENSELLINVMDESEVILDSLEINKDNLEDLDEYFDDFYD